MADPTGPCRATVHGTATAYRHGCRCPAGRDAYRRYQKLWEAGHTSVRLVDPTGTRRRVQALMVLGHNAETIARASGTGCCRSEVTRLTRRTARVTTGTRDAIRVAYTRLSCRRGDSAVTRNRALANGWVGPLDWDDIDDPACLPDVAFDCVTDPQHVDEIAVRRACHGDRVTLTDHERNVVVAELSSRGLSAAEIGARLGVTERTAQRYQRALRAPAAGRAA